MTLDEKEIPPTDGAASTEAKPKDEYVSMLPGAIVTSVWNSEEPFHVCVQHVAELLTQEVRERERAALERAAKLVQGCCAQHAKAIRALLGGE